jgi:hypothetical protein
MYSSTLRPGRLAGFHPIHKNLSGRKNDRTTLTYQVIAPIGLLPSGITASRRDGYLHGRDKKVVENIPRASPEARIKAMAGQGKGA